MTNRHRVRWDDQVMRRKKGDWGFLTETNFQGLPCLFWEPWNLPACLGRSRYLSLVGRYLEPAYTHNCTPYSIFKGCAERTVSPAEAHITIITSKVPRFQCSKALNDLWARSSCLERLFQTSRPPGLPGLQVQVRGCQRLIMMFCFWKRPVSGRSRRKYPPR